MSRSKGAGTFDDLVRAGMSVAVSASGMVVPVLPSSLSVRTPRYGVADGRTNR